MTPDKVEEMKQEFMKFLEPALDNGFDNGYKGADLDQAQKAYRDRYAWALDIYDWHTKALTQHHQDLMSKVVEKIICSAVRFQGKVWMGHRHGNALEAMHSELSYVMNRRQMNEQQTDKDQGFVTSSGRYVDRAEAWSIAEKAGQIIKREHQTKNCLYSEDVW